ncbi:hypothetical protein N8368_04300 [Bacteroidia bacterium]|nr:hypothetical protein [Bacteroidia bacterium]MDB9882703.1 hypothetical protein [Bacteroidia bacterium]MDC1395706.1 hypothetical protein [Bacteroidia bacterium]
MKYILKSTHFIFILTILFYLIGCNSNPNEESKKENDYGIEKETKAENYNYAQEEIKLVKDDQITEYGIVKNISDGAYPMNTITLEFPERQMTQSFSLNIEELSLQSSELNPLLNKYVTIKYTSELENNLTDLQLNGKTILGEEYILEPQDNWKSVMGVLSGADHVSIGDLPDAIAITTEKGEIFMFDYFITKEMTNGNEKEVTAKYITLPANDIKSIVPTAEIADEALEAQTTAKPEEPISTLDPSVEDYPSGTMMVNNSYLILQSTKSYSAAMHTAKQASAKLGFPIDYRGYVFDFREGLKDTATCGCGEIHGYIPRGRFDDGNYLSIEHTNSFTEFTNGYYIVVAASGDRNKIKPLLPKAKKFLADAYLKDAEVYIGCLH